ncbi:hypothetical protein FACS189431_2640 [Alphaproteobacteria bacterium]|nr:hypothetical protein FACS189431_2640 [Alphaproteobacteria bacterium]
MIKKIALTCSAIILTTFGLFIFGQNNSVEATLAGWNAGNIMSDYVMTNKNTMNESQIQAFLKSKNSCNDRGHGLVTSGVTSNGYRYTYHIKDGHYVCMADEVFGADGMPTNGAGQTAAHIIYQAAQDYSINPQVLIVLLQKEQRLVTDTYPSTLEYRSATGYGCFDTSACDSQYYGFINQVRNAALLFRQVQNNDFARFKSGTTQYVQYNPDAGCGGSNVYIANRATASLYRYTPYQPNPGALAAGTAEAPCGAYGNRNFYNYFTDWFGGTQYVIPSSNVHLPDGNYSFTSALSGNKSLDGNGPGDTVHLWDSLDINAQKFYLARTDDGFYTIKNLANGKYLDVVNASTSNGAKIQVYAGNGTCAQKWAIRTSGDKYTFLSACSGLAIDITNASSANGARAQIYTSNGTNAQKWTLRNLDAANITNGFYTVTTALSAGKAIDAYGSNNNVHLWDKLDIVAQKFQITRTTDGFYTIKNIGNGKVLDVVNASTSSSANVQVYASNGSCAQKWLAVKTGDYYEFLSACSGKALDIAGGTTNNDANIQIWDRNNTNAQKWSLGAVSVPQIANSTYVLISKMSGRALDVAGGGKTDGTNIQTWQRDLNTPNQRFAVSKGPNEYYTIKNIGNNKMVDLAGAGSADGTNIHVWSANNTCAQQWKIEYVDNDYYIITSACSGKAMDMGGNSWNSANVHLWERNNDNVNQLWRFNGL